MPTFSILPLCCPWDKPAFSFPQAFARGTAPLSASSWTHLALLSVLCALFSVLGAEGSECSVLAARRSLAAEAFIASCSMATHSAFLSLMATH